MRNTLFTSSLTRPVKNLRFSQQQKPKEQLYRFGEKSQNTQILTTFPTLGSKRIQGHSAHIEKKSSDWLTILLPSVHISN